MIHNIRSDTEFERVRACSQNITAALEHTNA